LPAPDNDFAWSSWSDASTAIEEIDELAGQVAAGADRSDILEVLFAPPGPIQEVSVSSGWGAEFLALSKRFDTALGL
jgi:hypothetical protein